MVEGGQGADLWVSAPARHPLESRLCQSTGAVPLCTAVFFVEHSLPPMYVQSRCFF